MTFSMATPRSTESRSIIALLIALTTCVASAAQEETLQSYKSAQTKTIALADRLVAATVAIIPSEETDDLERLGEGSGVIVSADGVILTAAHVTEGMGEHVVVILSDGRRVKADVLGSLPRSDAGMLKIAEPGEWPHADIGDSSKLHIGDWCLATGHALGYQRDRPAPLRLGRVLHVGDGQNMVNGIRTDAMIIYGDSGGPLYDLEGKVIGINSNTSSDPKENGHVPIDVFRKNWEQLRDGSPAAKPAKRKAMRARRRFNAEEEVPAEILDRYKRFAQLLQRKHAEGDKQLEQMLGDSGELTRLDSAQVSELFERWHAELESPVQPDNATPQPSKQLVRRLLRVCGESDELWDAIAAIDNSSSRMYGAVLNALADVTKPAAAYTAVIERNGQPAGFGIVVDRRGYIVTKASELRGKITVTLGERRLPARTITTRHGDDLALLKVDADDLAVATLAVVDPQRGAWLVIPDGSGNPIAMGIMSAPARPIPNRPLDLLTDPDQPALGIVATRRAKNARIGGVNKGSPAYEAGLRIGDVITAIDDSEIGSFKELASVLGQYKSGDVVAITYKRRGKPTETKVTLGAAVNLAGAVNDPQVNIVSGGKASLSKRRSGFDAALMHDSVIHARQCGGPVLDLDGHVVAMNIARADRSTTYAIPARLVAQLINEMIPK